MLDAVLQCLSLSLFCLLRPSVSQQQETEGRTETLRFVRGGGGPSGERNRGAPHSLRRRQPEVMGGLAVYVHLKGPSERHALASSILSALSRCLYTPRNTVSRAGARSNDRKRQQQQQQQQHAFPWASASTLKTNNEQSSSKQQHLGGSVIRGGILKKEWDCLGFRV